MSATYTVAALRAQLARYVRGDIDSQALAEWLIPLTWTGAGAPEALELARQVELSLMERSSGHVTDEELRAELRPLAGMDADAPSPAPAASASG